MDGRSEVDIISKVSLPSINETKKPELLRGETLALRRGEIRALTGLRGVAACCVMLYHFHNYKGSSGPLHRMIFHGYLAVDLFFVLSGFVMALTYARSFQIQPSFSMFSAFLYKRIARTYPLYLVITLLTILAIYMQWIKQPVPTVTTISLNLLLCQSWGLAKSIGGPTWSISTEFAAYLLFPVLASKVVNGRPLWRWLAGALGIAALLTVSTRSSAELHQVILGQPHRDGPLDAHGDAYVSSSIYQLLRCLGGFTLGVLAYALSFTSPLKKAKGYRGLTDALVVTILVLLAVPDSDVVIALLFAPLVILLGSERGIVARIMRSAVVYWLGMVSYSIYLCHFFILHLLQPPIRSFLAKRHIDHVSLVTVLLTAIVMAVSTLTYCGIEKPARDWLRRYSGGKKSSIALEPSAP